jgi:hypothetical protein
LSDIAGVGPSTADIEGGIRAELATIARHWPYTFDPPRSAGVGASPVPASRLPGNDTAISLRAEVTRDLAFWVHALLDDNPDAIAAGDTIDCSDVPGMVAFLTRQARWVSGWEWGNRMWSELVTLAREVKALAAPPVRDTMPIGECPECGTVVRAKAHDPGNIKCRGCGTTDTIDGWIIRVVGNEPLVTAEQLVPILHKRMGIVVTRAAIRQWVRRGVIEQAETDEAGRALFNRKDVFKKLIDKDAPRDDIAGVC